MKRPFLSLMAGLCGALALAACSGPGAMPRGYTYHQERFKSPAPGPSGKISDAARENMTPDQARQIRSAVHTLARRLTDRAGLAPRPVYVQTADPLIPFYAMVDNDLRDVLVHIGYRLSDVPDDAYIFQYDAAMRKRPDAMIDDEQTHQQPNITITLRVIDQPGRDGRVLTTQSDDFFIQGVDDLDISHAHFPIMQKAGE
jgi:hypothetical protein